ncbi:putative pollen-specific leucine-rich repeat extensin-like protein 3 [Iris pallida]|uniref:Pollen-specific leucine-rich repeat extensin-like protein 3 n=1 Tax=Iris pallida TaxID=29817 RepID=A0AAX6GP22_IRIPA|nr:putative pollen-specific leucine-rich repeat extensin-like protein 3 [Iris pallida]
MWWCIFGSRGGDGSELFVGMRKCRGDCWLVEWRGGPGGVGDGELVPVVVAAIDWGGSSVGMIGKEW